MRFRSFQSGVPLLSVTAALILFSCTPHRVVKTVEQAPSLCGNTDLPIWSPLTDFDAMALGGEEKARAGDPDALLALALFASGDVRDQATWEAYHGRVLTFVEKVRRDAGGDTSDYGRGKVLFDGVCREFFRHRFVDDELKGYDFAQSKLSGVFASAKFNCVSSALLYVVCARYLGLNVNIAVIPSHVFVQQTLRDGRKIDIETTGKQGYDFKNDKSSFERYDGNWFKARGLVMPTFGDYTKREIISPLEAVVRNMINQHTEAGRMADADRYRLLEAMGFCYPGVKEYEHCRLVALYNEVIELQRTEDYPSMARFFKKMAPVVHAIDSVSGSDTSFGYMVASLRLSHAFAIFKTTGAPAAADTAADILAHASDALPDYKKLVNNIGVIVQLIIDKGTKENRFEESEAVAQRFSRYPDLLPWMRYLESYIYGSWAARLWPQKDWSTVIRLLQKAISLSVKDEDRKALVSNIKGAYYNWTVELYNGKRLAESLNLLEACEKDFGLDGTAIELKKRIVAAMSQ
ncbi:MAG TPA: hypothetical protein VLX68_17375 [Chitinivibrionales bacterium]|nr:hypothetical protein [Chitinivibrionales bacterium]